jgi:hypothetical protein
VQWTTGSLGRSWLANYWNFSELLCEKAEGGDSTGMILPRDGLSPRPYLVRNSATARAVASTENCRVVERSLAEC